jgi:ornithine carbamoyltransferase
LLPAAAGRSPKLARYAGTEAQRLQGKEIALIFEKTSTRPALMRWERA